MVVQPVMQAVDRVQAGHSVVATPKFAFANIAAGTTDGAIVAAVTGKRILVLLFRVMAGGTATTFTFTTKPGGAGSAISETYPCGINGGQAGSYSPVGHFRTDTGEGLSGTTGAGATVAVGVVYVEVDP